MSKHYRRCQHHQANPPTCGYPLLILLLSLTSSIQGFAPCFVRRRILPPHSSLDTRPCDHNHRRCTAPLSIRHHHHHHNLVVPRRQSRNDDDTAASPPHLTVLIPAYNEERRIASTLRAYRDYLQTSWPGPSAIVVANDGSRDNTTAVVQAVAAEQQPDSTITIECVELPSNRGKGAALAYGVAQIVQSPTACLIVTTDADGSAPPTALRDLYQRWRTTVRELVQVNPNDDHDDGTPVDVSALCQSLPLVVAGYRTYASAAQSRLLFRWGFRTVVQLCLYGLEESLPSTAAPTKSPFQNPPPFLSSPSSPLLLGTRDTQCGMKLLTVAAAAPLYRGLHLQGWSHDVEVLWRAKLYKMPVVEQQVPWEDKTGSKLVETGLLKVTFRMLWDVLQLRYQYQTGRWKLPD